MAESERYGIGIDIEQEDIEVNTTPSSSGTWSLDCGVTIEDVDATIRETVANDIILSGIVNTEELSVDIDRTKDNVMDLDVNFNIGGLNPAIVESQVVSYDEILKITSISPESTSEKKFATSARAAKTINDSVATISKRVNELAEKVQELESKEDNDSTDNIVTGGYWILDKEDGSIHTYHDIHVHGSAIITGDTASGGTGDSSTSSGLNEEQLQQYLDEHGYVTEDDLDGLVPDVDLSGYATKDYVTEEVDKAKTTFFEMWSLDDVGNLVTSKQVIIKNNLIVEGDTASGGSVDSSTQIGITEERLQEYLDENKYVTSDDVAGLIPDIDISAELEPYAKKEEVDEALLNIEQKKADKSELSKYVLLDSESQTIKGDIRIEGNLVVTGDTASGGTGDSSTDVGLNEELLQKYLDENNYVTEDKVAGLIPDVDLSSYYTIQQVNDIVEGLDNSIKDNANAIITLGNKITPIQSWYDQLVSVLVKDGDNLRVKTNLIIEGDTASGGEAGDASEIAGTVKAVKVGEDVYDEVSNGVLDMTEAFEGLQGVGDKQYEHIQAVATETWTVDHDLNKFPSVSIVDSSGNIVYGDVTYESKSRVLIRFSAAFGGKAYLN